MYVGTARRHRIDKYLDIILANQTALKALPLTIARSRNRKMADCPSYVIRNWLRTSRTSEITNDVSSAVT